METFTDPDEESQYQRFKARLLSELSTKLKPVEPEFILPDWINKEDWDLWMQTRKGKKMLPAQKQAQVKKLACWRYEGIDYAKALSDAAAAGWAGLHVVKANTGNRVQEARLGVVEQIFGGLQHEARRTIKDITTRPSITSVGASISETYIGIREPDASEVAGD